MENFNKTYPDLDGIYYQSYAGKLPHWYSDIFLWFSRLTVKIFEGDNDGLVSVNSAKWGEFKGVIESTGMQGISHIQGVDGYRHRFSKKVGNNKNQYGDICDFYLDVAKDLEERGF
jgi:triacylglycerol lipase